LVVKAALLGMTVMTVMTGAALGQESTHPKTSLFSPKAMTQQTIVPPVLVELAKPALPQYAIIRREEPAIAPKGPMIVPEGGYAPWTAREATPGKAPETVVIRYGPGGRMDAHYALYTDYRRAKTKVEVRGPCYSACTLVLAYVEHICIAEGAFMAFHAVRSVQTNARMDDETRRAYTNMPLPIRRWIDDNGGHEKLPLDSFWTLRDRELWAMGYPRCAP
jgi:hypothetical protein